MANTLNLGNGNWGVKKDSLLGYNSENGNFKPLPFEFERASSATVVNKDGLIETVGSGEPRIDYRDDVNGALLLEPQRTNIITYSEDFSNSYWTKSGASVVSDAAISPDGSLNAFKLVEDTSTGGHFLYKQLTTTALSTYTASVFAKVGENDFIILQDPFSSGNPRQWFDLNNGILGTGTNISNASIIPFGNGFYKCTVTWVISSTTGGLGINTSKLDNSTSYTGDGTSGVYIYGAQLEQGSYATSYIPTQGGVVTRNSDSCLQGGFQDKNIFGSTQGTAVFDIKWDELNYIFDFNVGGVEVIRIYNDNNTQWRIRDTTTSSWYYTGFNITQGQRTKIGFKWSGTEIVAFQNGVKSLNNGLIGSNTSVESITTNKLNNTSNMQFYNTALTDQELIALTQV